MRSEMEKARYSEFGAGSGNGEGVCAVGGGMQRMDVLTVV